MELAETGIATAVDPAALTVLKYEYTFRYTCGGVDMSLRLTVCRHMTQDFGSERQYL